MLSGVHFWLTFVGVTISMLPGIVLGLIGRPQRYVDYADCFAVWNAVSTAGSVAAALGTLVFLIVVIDMFVSRRPLNQSRTP